MRFTLIEKFDETDKAIFNPLRKFSVANLINFTDIGIYGKFYIDVMFITNSSFKIH